MSITIRDATSNDAALILSFITELAIYEKAEDQVLATEATITRSIFGPDSVTHAVICENNHEPIGFAVYFYNYSTWLAKNGLYLEDLYVTEAARGLGAGKALLKHLAKIAVANDCGRFEWSVLDWNEPSIQFYEALGAKPKNEWIGYQLTGDDLLAFANA